jgi:hypothetical protein
MNYPLEDAEQHAYIQWLDANNIKYFAVPNIVKLAGMMKSKIAKIRFWQQRKKEGVKKGVPDLVVFLPKLILFVEMKRQKGSATSIEQINWSITINTYPYAKSIICKGADVAINETKAAQ